MTTPEQGGTSRAEWHRVSPVAFLFYLFRVLRLAGTQGLPGIIVLAGAAASSEKITFTWIAVGAIVLLIVIAVIAFLSYLRFRYRISSDQVLVRRGILHREELNIDFDRVQNVSIKELFYMRPFGLSVMSIDTAGSQGREIDIAGVPVSLARDFRNTILEKRGFEATGQARSTTETTQEPGDASAPPGSERLLLHLDNRDVALYGLTSNFLLWVAIAIGAFFGTGDFADQALAWVGNRLGLANAVNSMVEAGDFLGLVLWTLLIVLAVAVLLPTLSVLGALFRYHDYRLTEDRGTYRRESGLATKHQDSVKQHKIQAVVCKQNAVGRLLGRVNLQLRQASAGTGMEDGQMPGLPGSVFVVPSLQPAEARTLSSEFLPGCRPQDVQWSAVSLLRYMRVGMAGIVLPALAITTTPSILVSPLFLLIVPLIAALLWPILYLSWKRLAYCVVGDHGFIRRGFIGSNVTQFPLFKIQRIDLRQTPWQRRAGFAKLHIHLASHSLEVPHMPVDDARRFANLALQHAEASKQPWF